MTRVSPRDRDLVARHLTAWVDELTAIGYRPEFARAVHGEVPDAMVALVFTPTAAFQQTPGPGAGDRLRS